jgi:putative ABC transport system permease protein
MTLREIALKNLLRRRGKTAFILAGLVIGVATVVAVLGFSDAMTRDINHKLEKYGANILIVPKTENLTLSYGGLNLGGFSFGMTPMEQSVMTDIRNIKNAANIAAAGPVVLGTTHIKNHTVLVAGMDFKAQGILKPWWRVSGRFPEKEGLIAGSEAARLLNLEIGDSLAVEKRNLTVSGILEPTGSQDDQLLFGRLATVQNLLGKEGQISMVEVAALCNACPINEMVAQLSGKIPTAKIMAIQQVVKGRMDTISRFKSFAVALSIVVVLVSGMVVLVTLMGSVRERTTEIGILRAVGFRHRDIMQLIFLETGMISLMAGVIGYFVGLGGVWAALKFLTSTDSSAIPMALGPAVAAVTMALMVGYLASAYPAALASRMEPHQALKTL